MWGWLQLFRPPNLFTAMADILGGWCLIRGALDFEVDLVLVLLVSALFYAAGVVLNDVFDVERDRLERPRRPIPSGRVGLRSAALLGFALLLGGDLFAWMLSRPCGLVGALLIIAILLYDAVLKNTWVAPGVMGLCRALNWSLGMTAAGLDPLSGPVPIKAVLLALAAWSYVTGITWFARHEAAGTTGRPVISALLLSAAGAALFPVASLIFAAQRRYYALLALTLIAVVCNSGLRAAREPAPDRIQSTVRLMVLGLVPLDASVAFVFGGHLAGLLTLALLIPAVLIARKLYVT